MSAENLNFSVDTSETSIVLETNEISISPTVIDLSLTVASPGPANLSFEISPASANIVVTNNQLSFNPSSVNMAVHAGGFGVPGGTSGTIQFNNGGQLGGISTATYANGVLTLGNVANIKISGGNANSVLRTDGNGNLSFGGPIVGGGNTQVQYNNNGNIAGKVNFTFDNTTDTLGVPKVTTSNLAVSGNAFIGAYYYANGQPLNLSNTYSNSNVAAYLSGGGLFTGVVNDIHGAGDIVSTSASGYSGRETYMPTNTIASVYGFSTDNTYIYSTDGVKIYRSTDGQNWSSVYYNTLYSPTCTAYNGSVYVATTTTGVLYSSNGTSWTNGALTGGATKVIVFGTTFIAINSTGVYSSTNGSSWTSRSATTGLVDIATNGSVIVAITASAGVYSSNITTWSNITASTFTTATHISASNTTFVVSQSSLVSTTHWRSTNGSAWTSFSTTLGGYSYHGYMNYNSSIGYWVLRSVTPVYGGYDIITTDFTNYSYRNAYYMGMNPYFITEDFTVGAINLLRSNSDITNSLPSFSMRKIPQNLIYKNLQTMSTAPTGNYMCMGSISTNYNDTIYTWLAM